MNIRNATVGENGELIDPFTKFETELEEKQQEINELKAYIERLKGMLINAANHLDYAARHGYSMDKVRKCRDDANSLINSIPSQPLNHLLAQVEEETVERYEDWAESTNGWNSKGGFPYKYKDQSDEGGE